MPEPPTARDAAPAGSPITVPQGLVRVHLLFLVVAAWAYCFLCYCILRALLADFGLSFATIAKATIATAAMGGFIVWLVPLAELPEILFGHAIPQRRAARGRCPACGYDLQGRRGVRCPECGHDGSVPGTWHLSWHTARRFLLVLLAGLVLGVAAGEAWTTADERAFISEARELQHRIDARLDGLGPFDERLVVLTSGREEPVSSDSPDPGFAWLMQNEVRPAPAERVRGESMRFGGGTPLLGRGGREEVETLRRVWSWERRRNDDRPVYHLDLRHLQVRGEFVLTLGEYRVRGVVVRDRFDPRASGEDASIVDGTAVLVRPVASSEDAPREVVLDTVVAERQRPRAWPAGFASMRYTPERGIEVIDPFHSPRVVDWSPRRR